MIGADEAVLCNSHGMVIIVRRGPDRLKAVRLYKELMIKRGISFDLHPDEIRLAMAKANQGTK